MTGHFVLQVLMTETRIFYYFIHRGKIRFRVRVGVKKTLKIVIFRAFFFDWSFSELFSLTGHFQSFFYISRTNSKTSNSMY